MVKKYQSVLDLGEKLNKGGDVKISNELEINGTADNQYKDQLWDEIKR
jgi:hypothetical protein